jgi:Uma2 family endonuclease
MSTATLTTKRMTVDEFAEWASRPENDNKWFELVRGEVIELSAPTKRHGVVVWRVARALDAYICQRGKGYLTINDSGVILERDPDTVRGPDVALYEDAQSFDELHPKYGEVPPILAVEGLSPNDRADRTPRKITDYLRYGVALVWLVDPETRTVTVYPADNGPRLLEESDELDGGEHLPGLRCRVADFFHLPGEQPQQQARSPRAPRRKKKNA